MAPSTFELFKIGIGPSSSHTVGPMRAAARFADQLATDGHIDRVTRVKAELFGSLGATGHGHGSVNAVLWGLEGEAPETIDVARAPARAEQIKTAGRLTLAGGREIAFAPDADLILHRTKSLEHHSNGMKFTAWAGDDHLAQHTYWSVGGGFVLASEPDGTPKVVPDPTEVPHPFRTGDELLTQCREHGLSVSELMLANESARRPEAETIAKLDEIWAVMQECVANGVSTTGVLPGGLRVRRRASEVFARLNKAGRKPIPAPQSVQDPFAAVDWVTLWALAVNEENAAGGRVVTAPTNGAAGVIPAVMHYATSFAGLPPDCTRRFLLAAAAIGAIYQQSASISGAEVGCQGEVGTACSMAAAGLAEVSGATPEQVECAAEIGMEHNLGMTCDPVGGLVQIPCIERNAIAAVKAITAARLALHGDGTQKVSLDQVIRTMMETGADMKVKYKETARGGLAVNIVEC